jgi:hypothetical protein
MPRNRVEGTEMTKTKPQEKRAPDADLFTWMGLDLFMSLAVKASDFASKSVRNANEIRLAEIGKGVK